MADHPMEIKVRVTPQVHQRLAQFARDEERSLSSLCRHILRQHAEQYRPGRSQSGEG